jgi:hypothetical protein
VVLGARPGRGRGRREEGAGAKREEAEAEEVGGRRGTGPDLHASDTMKVGRMPGDSRLDEVFTQRVTIYRGPRGLFT